MSVFITGTGVISPQNSFGVREFSADFEDHGGPTMRAILPDYKEFIQPRLLRRMSGILKMGVASGTQALRDAGIEAPDAIATATALGCTHDTHRFLKDMIEREEQALSPTSFIQSTHNTIGGQIALQMGLHAYNMTYTQRGSSFESALLDAMMLLESNSGQNVLLGGIDEVIEPSETLMRRLGMYRTKPTKASELLKEPARGSIGGEGASFFVLSNGDKNAYARVSDVETLYKPNGTDPSDLVLRFLERNDLKTKDIDLVISGRSGDQRGDWWYDRLKKTHFQSTSEAVFKPLCGEYQSAIGFAFWMAAVAIRNGRIPEYSLFDSQAPKKIDRVLIYNHFQERNHAFILLER